MNKVCSTCKIDKTILDFGIKNGEPRGQCKQCEKDYRILNRDRIRRRGQEYESKNKNKSKERRAKYRALNRGLLREKNKEYGAKNREKIHLKWEKYSDENRPHINKLSRDGYQRRKEIERLEKLKLESLIHTVKFDDNYKICECCRNIKGKVEFPDKKYTCLECRKTKQKEYYYKNHEKRKEYRDKEITKEKNKTL